MTVKDVHDGNDPPLLQMVAGALRGGAAAKQRTVDELYKRYAGRITRYMAHFVRTRAESEDLMHEVFVRVLRKLDTLNQGAERFEAWLWTIAHNLRIDELRSRQLPQGDIELGELADQGPVPEQCVQTDDLQDCFAVGYEGFRQGFPDHAHALSLVVTDQLSIREIASILQRTEQATRQYLMQCRLKLKPYLQPCAELLV